MAHLVFSNGDRMPALGLGTWKAPAEEVSQAVRTALELGYRHIDCASVYGNEVAIGAALSQAFADGLVQREEVWVTSKLWNDCHDPRDVRPALERSLADLRLSHLDLYLIHWPVAHRHGVIMPALAADQLSLEQRPLAKTWCAMEEILETGLSQHIGVSNMSAARLERLLNDGRQPPEVNQVERHPYLQQTELLIFCQQSGIHLTAYAPLGSPPPGQASTLLTDPVIQEIATQRGITSAQVLLAWGLACHTAVIPKSVNRDRLKANLAAAEIRLTASELNRIATLDRGERSIDGSAWVLPGGPYSLGSLWDQ